MNKKSIWNELLIDATSKNKKLNGNILVLGGKNTGKKELINSLEKINGNEIRPEPLSEYSIFKYITEYEKNYLIDYRLLIINSEENDEVEIGKLNFIIINEFWDNIDEFLNKDIIENLMVLIVLDSTNPHNFLKELMDWMNILDKKLIKIFEKLTKEEYMKYISKVNKMIENMNNKLKENYNFEMIKNLGFPICVACNKCDELQEKFEKKEIEIINYNLRKFCINNSAGLIYTSSKLQTNIDTLYKYINYTLLNYGKVDKIDLNLNSFFITNCFENNEVLDEIYNEYKDVNYEILIKPNKKKVQETIKDSIEDTNHELFLVNLNKSENENRINRETENRMDELLRNN